MLEMKPNDLFIFIGPRVNQEAMYKLFKVISIYKDKVNYQVFGSKKFDINFIYTNLIPDFENNVLSIKNTNLLTLITGNTDATS